MKTTEKMVERSRLGGLALFASLTPEQIRERQSKAARVRKHQNLADRFWSKVDRAGPVHPALRTACWVWCGATRNGYGLFRAGGGTRLAHRVAWEQIAGKELPEGQNVLHRCDNPACVNFIDHLFIGTQKANMVDCVNKGRTATGESGGNTKLDRLSVEVIRIVFRAGVSQRKLGRWFGVTNMAINSIVRRKTWRDVP